MSRGNGSLVIGHLDPACRARFAHTAPDLAYDPPMNSIDQLDAKLILILADNPRAGVMEMARQLGVARGTVQARLDKLVSREIITGFGPDIDLETLDYGVLAFVTLEIAQGRLDDVVDHLRTVPEVIEAHATTGSSDVLLRVVAKSNRDLQDVLHRVLEVSGIERTVTHIALSEQIPFRVRPIVELLDVEDPEADFGGVA